MKRIQPLDLSERMLRDQAHDLRHRAHFSPELHQRIMTSLRADGLRFEQPAPVSRFRPIWRMALPAGIAALIAAGAWIALQSIDFTPPRQAIVVSTKPVKNPPPVLTAHVESAATALEKGKYAYLDRDANRFFIFVADQIPSFTPPK